MKPTKALEGRDIIIELNQVGSVVRATAVDVKTMTEAHIQGPASSPQSVLQGNAMRKLEYVLRKKGVIE